MDAGTAAAELESVWARNSKGTGVDHSDFKQMQFSLAASGVSACWHFPDTTLTHDHTYLIFAEDVMRFKDRSPPPVFQDCTM